MVLVDIDAKGYTFRLSSLGGYFSTDNMAAGGRFTYSRTCFNIGNVDISLGDDLSFHVRNDMYLGHNYSALGSLRICMGLGSSKMFGLPNEVRLTYAYGQGKYFNGTGNDLTGYYQRSHAFEIGAAPGLMAFVSDFVSVEVSIGAVGFSYEWVD